MNPLERWSEERPEMGLAAPLLAVAPRPGATLVTASEHALRSGKSAEGSRISRRDPEVSLNLSLRMSINTEDWRSCRGSRGKLIAIGKRSPFPFFFMVAQLNPTVRLFFVLSVCSVLALTVGYMLSTDLVDLVIWSVGVLAVGTLPTHGWLGPRIFFATFLATFLVPFAPGRPYLWEAALLACWTGLVMSSMKRRLDPGFGENVRRYRWILVGSCLYVMVLVALMVHHGAGLRVLGTSSVGGRFYFQQIIAAIIPLAFIAHPLKERELRVLFLVATVLTLTGVVADMVYSYGSGLEPLLLFLGTPGDAENFESQALKGGLRRFQSLMSVSQAFIFFLLVRFGGERIISFKGLWVWLVMAGLLSVGILSGHRMILYTVFSTGIIYLASCRCFNWKSAFFALIVSLLSLVLLYGLVDRLPLAAQRAVSFLPGLQISRMAEDDGIGTFETRRLLREVGWEMMPDYLLVGRGLSIPEGFELANLWDPSGVAQFAAMGRFFNGFIGQMVNTGLPGTLTIAIVWLAGSRLAWLLLKRCWEGRAESFFLRLGALFAAQWFSSLFTYVFLHGDSESGLRMFTPLIGFMIAADLVLRRVGEVPKEATGRPLSKQNIPATIRPDLAIR